MKRYLLPLLVLFLALSSVGMILISGRPPSDAAITYVLKCTFTLADKDFADTDVIDSDDGCETGSITVTEAAGTAVAVASNRLSLTQDADADNTEVGIVDTDAVTRSLGLVLLASIESPSATIISYPFGLKDDTTLNTPDFGFYLQSETWRYKIENTRYDVLHPAFAAATEYEWAIVAGGYDSSGVPYKDGDTAANFTYGASFFLKQGGTWKLQFRHPSAVPDDDAVYLVSSVYTASGNLLIDDIKIPDPASHTEEGLLGADPLLALHTFSSDSDTPDKGSAFTDQGNTWTIAAGAITNTPSLGASIWDSAAAVFTSGTYAWDAYGTNTIANDANQLKVTYVDNAGGAHVQLSDAEDLSADLTVGTWYQYQADFKVGSGDSVDWNVSAGPATRDATVTATALETHTNTWYATNATGQSSYFSSMGAGEDVWTDNISLKALTTNELFYTVDSGDDDVFVTAEFTRDISGKDWHIGGVALCLDSASSPTDYLIGYYDSGASLNNDVVLTRSVAGTIVDIVGDTAETYSAGAPVTVIKDGNTAYLFYNNRLIGSGDVTDIASNTIHGLFSTHSSNSFDNVLIQSLGSDGQYSNLSNY